MRSGFKGSMLFAAVAALATSMVGWSKGFMAKAEPLPPGLKNVTPHSFARKSRVSGNPGEGRQGQANRALIADYNANPMNFLPGRITCKLMKLDEVAMLRAAREKLAELHKSNPKMRINTYGGHAQTIR